MQNANDRIGKFMLSLFVSSKLIDKPALHHFIILKSDYLLYSISQNFFLNIPYPVKFFNKCPVSL